MAARRDCVSPVYDGDDGDAASSCDPPRFARLSFLSFSPRRTTLVYWLAVFGAASYDDPLLEFYGSTDDVCTVTDIAHGIEIDRAPKWNPFE